MKLVIMTGAPASGKSSIAEAVGKKLGIDVISKDGFKIELFEKFGFTSHAEKKKLSIKGEKIMHDTIESYVEHNLDLIVDNNFKHFNVVRDILSRARIEVEVKCVYCIADYNILAKRYNERISSGNRHLALYTLNQYPVIEGISEFHPLITRDDVERIEHGIQEFTFGKNVLEINTDNIESEFEVLCDRVIEFINKGATIMDEFSIVKKSKNPKTIAMLSGGKDSIASVILLKKSGIDVTAIHFVHKWGAEIPTDEAVRICNEYQIPLIIKDYTQEFCDAVNGYMAGRPCLLCKKQMYKVLLEYMSSNKFGWLCIGDNSNDRTTIARINQFIYDGHSEDNLMCSGYFGSEMGIVLPEGMKVIRPLINMDAKDVENFLGKAGIVIKRINSTGDKYFEYHREGCPVQFADIGVELNEKLYCDLKTYNDCITEFARKEGILASIHMPSTFIITIPRGYEKKAADYLEIHGLSVNKDVNSSDIPGRDVFIGYVYDLKRNMLVTGAYEKVFNRFLERLELYGNDKIINVLADMVVCTYRENEASLKMILNFKNAEADIRYSFSNCACSRKDKAVFDNLILEMFRTRKYRVDKL